MTERAYDEDLRALLPLLPTVQDLGSLEAIVAARSERASFVDPPPDRDDVLKEDRNVPGAAGDPEVPIRIYRPRQPSDGLRPALLEIHGGGFLFGDIEMMDPWCQQVSAEVDAVVVSVGYRLAPEHPFPAGLEDCYAALCWLSSHAEDLGVDAARIAVGGQSAGGGLAAATALLARDRSGPSICFQLLEIPELDDRLDTPSIRPSTTRRSGIVRMRSGAGVTISVRTSVRTSGRTHPARSRPTRLQLARATSPASRRPTSPRWSSTRCATRA